MSRLYRISQNLNLILIKFNDRYYSVLFNLNTKFLSRDAVAARCQVFKKKFISKSVATSSLLEYTGSEIFASGISPTKRLSFDSDTFTIQVGHNLSNATNFELIESKNVLFHEQCRHFIEVHVRQLGIVRYHGLLHRSGHSGLVPQYVACP